MTPPLKSQSVQSMTDGQTGEQSSTTYLVYDNIFFLFYYNQFQVMVQRHNRHMSFSMYISVLAVSDTVTLTIDKAYSCHLIIYWMDGRAFYRIILSKVIVKTFVFFLFFLFQRETTNHDWKLLKCFKVSH